MHIDNGMCIMTLVVLVYSCHEENPVDFSEKNITAIALFPKHLFVMQLC